MKKKFMLSFLPVTFLLCSFSKHQIKKDDKRPNLLIVLVDQWRGQALGFLKQEPVFTPNLDSFAARSRVLNQTVCNYPLCSPSRAMLMTGKYPMHNKVYSNVNSKTAAYGVELSAEAVCWSDLLKEAGYSNGYIGKWHLDSPVQPFVSTSNNKRATAWNEWTSPDRRHGFDYWYGYGTYDRHMKPMYWNAKASRDEFHFVDQWGPEHETDKAIEFLNNYGNTSREQDGPFSLVVSMNPPHSIYSEVPKKYYDLYKDIPLDSLVKDPDIPAKGTEMGDTYRKDIRSYYACMTGVDDQFGRLMNGLRSKGLEKNTIVIFMADHGNCLGKHNEISKNTFYEESVRIPFIISWAGHIRPGIDNQLLFSVADIYPTILDLLDVKGWKKYAEGLSYKNSFLTGRQEPVINHQFLIGNVNAADPSTGFRGVRTSQYKLVYERKGKNTIGYLFDLKNDPFELENLYLRSSDVVTKLKKNLKEWLKEANDPFKVED